MMDKEKFLEGLNPAQREAVCAPPGALLIIAGAGSGKTRVLTHRMAYFIASGIPPSSILALTFTNKAADEMRNRVSGLVNVQFSTSRFQAASPQPFIGTFHALALRMLRERGERIGVPKGFMVADESDTLAIMKRIMKRRKVAVEDMTPSEALNMISHWKNELVPPENIAAQSDKERIAAGLYKDYCTTLSQEKLVDFDDLLYFAAELLQKDKESLAAYRQRFRHILVDEYQDTNTAQYRIVSMLAASHRSITAVGDDYQAIYGWRGADYRNILKFRNDYPEAKVIKLEQNYRSTQNILDAADAVIKKVSARTEKTLVAVKPVGSPVTVARLSDEEDEALFVIERLHAKRPRRLSDAVVLYRTNAQSRPFEELLMREKVPYRIIGGVRFYERKEVKDILAFLRYVRSPDDRTSMERIINIPPRGIGKVGLERILEHGLDTAAQTSEAARDFRALLRALREKQSAAPLSAFLAWLAKAINYRTYLRENYAAEKTWRVGEGDERWENVGELIDAAKRYDTLPSMEAAERFLEDVALYTSADAVDPSANALNLMTMHLAKGLEFGTVFLAGCEEGLLPHARSIGDPEAMDEERRLCYVALTRAKDEAYMTFVRERTMHGERRRPLPSRFLSDIPDGLVSYHGGNPREPELVDEWEEW